MQTERAAPSTGMVEQIVTRSLTMGGGEQPFKRKIFINGQLIPDRQIALAEQRVGKIEAGRYWYDPTSGFWGPMGGPAFGIVQPMMREFGSGVLARDSSGGRTGVFLNGREVHKKELNILVRKGLPDAPGGNFILEADGTVYDCSTQQSLGMVGKLFDEKRKTAGMFMKLS